MQKEDFSFDVNKICRLCLHELQDGSFLDLFTINLPVSPLVMINRCTTIEIYEKDGLPSGMCNNCYYQLETAFEFRNRCESSDQKLREYHNIPNGDGKNELLLSMNERTEDRSKEDDIYAAMSEIFGPEEEAEPSIITPQTLGNLLDETTKEPSKGCSSAKPPVKVKVKRQIKRKAQLDELLEKHKEKLWLSTKGKMIHQRRTQWKRLLGGKKHDIVRKAAELGKRPNHDEANSFECSVCQQRFSRSSYLRLHQRIHSNERNFQCEICSKLFRTSSNLHAHLKTHTEERNYVCGVCKRAFRTSRDLASHSETHSEEKGYVCHICNKAFVKQSYLNTHKNTVHVGLKRYRCQECGKQFSNSSNLIAHRRIHTGEKPYECGECDAKFNQSSALTRHMRQQHRPKVPSPEPAPMVVARESEPEELSIEVDENRSLESAASSELSVATSLMDSQSFSYGGMPYAQTFVPQPTSPPPSAQHFSHVPHQHHHLHHSHLAAASQQLHPYHHRHHQQQHHPHHHHPHHPHAHQHSQPIMHQSMAVNQPGANLYSAEYLPPYHSTALPSTQQTHYELGGGYDMCYSMSASTVLNPSLMNPQPTYIFDQ
ncbi:zinc finger protein 551-like isoform X1 [Anopheles moucheti]|uniref:zinc finger protein 551-like isoform X1 n=1 Tax=Anopheles moucheti TaxID=186751 RepID=UPI0022F017D2|nr:zinc finger protein 551-like isoform X1 [Anopheles moucheti]